MHRTEFVAAGKAEVSYELCALRNMPYAGLVRVSVVALQDLKLDVASQMEIPAEYTDGKHEWRSVDTDGIMVNMLHAHARSLAGATGGGLVGIPVRAGTGTGARLQRGAQAVALRH